MTGDQYLQSIIQKYAVNETAAKTAGQSLVPTVQRWAGNYLLGMEFSGSLAKGTAVSLGTDADIFLSISSSTPTTLANMYESLFSAISGAGYSARKQNVSIGVSVNGLSIDLVPGKRQSQYGNDHSLYRSKVGSWTKTNIAKHINHVASSGRSAEIRVLKIWRQLNRLSFPSFFLELAVLDALSYARIGNLAQNVFSVFEYLQDDIASVRLIDPANTNNVVSDDATLLEKMAIAELARKARAQTMWSGIVW